MILRFMDELGIERAMVVGHDTGGGSRCRGPLRGLAARKVLHIKDEKLLSRDFAPGGNKVEYRGKDLGIASAAGREHGAALPVTALVDQMFGALVTKEWAGDEAR